MIEDGHPVNMEDISENFYKFNLDSFVCLVYAKKCTLTRLTFKIWDTIQDGHQASIKDYIQ